MEKWGNLHSEWRNLPVLNGEISILNGEIPVLNGEISVLNGEISVLHSEWRNHRFEWIIFADMFNFESFFFCGTLNGLHLFPKNETICIQNGDVPFLEGYLFILVVGLPRGIRDISIIFSSKEWIHHTFTCRNLICVLLIFFVRHWNMNRCFFLRGIYNLEAFMQ